VVCPRGDRDLVLVILVKFFVVLVEFELSFVLVE
jgi:hypothetical protein